MKMAVISAISNEGTKPKDHQRYRVPSMRLVVGCVSVIPHRVVAAPGQESEFTKHKTTIFEELCTEIG